VCEGGEACNQREGMGLLEYQTLATLHDVAYDRWLYMYIYYVTAAGNSISSQLGSSCQGNQYGKEKEDGRWPIHHIQITPARSLSSSRRVGPAL